MIINKHNIVAGNMPFGGELNIIKYEIDSEKEGPTVYMQSGMHGGEVTQWILHNLFPFLKENLKFGKVIIIPFANPAAWTQRSYFSTNGKFDLYMGKDWNRNFPGKEDGTLGERISKKLLNEAKKSDFVFDLHTARESNPFGIFMRNNMLEYIKTMNIPFNHFINIKDKPAYSNTLNYQLDKLNIPTITIECGSHDEYCEEKNKLVEEAIKRVLSKLNMIDKNLTKKSNNKVKYFEKTKTIRSEKGGLIKYNVKAEDEFKKGDLLFSLIDPNDMENEYPVFADCDGFVFKLSPTNIYWSGDDVLQIIEKEEISEI